MAGIQMIDLPVLMVMTTANLTQYLELYVKPSNKVLLKFFKHDQFKSIIQFIINTYNL